MASHYPERERRIGENLKNYLAYQNVSYKDFATASKIELNDIQEMLSGQFSRYDVMLQLKSHTGIDVFEWTKSVQYFSAKYLPDPDEPDSSTRMY